MKLSKLVGLSAVICLLFASVNLHADSWNKKTIVTVYTPFIIPGATLTPGTYVFKLMDSQLDRHIVQVFNEDQSYLIATIFTVPCQRPYPRGKTEFGFSEMADGSLPALRYWFYPGDYQGQEFAYPRYSIEQVTTTIHVELPSPDDEYPY
jgi:hypothetical protein